MQEQLQHASKEQEDLRRENARLTESLERQSETQRKLENDCQEMNEQLCELEVANQEMDEHVRGLELQKAVLEQRQQQQMLQLQEGDVNVSLLQQKEELLSQVQVFTSANQELRQKVTQLEQNVEELKQELDRKEIETSDRQRRGLLTLGSNYEIVNFGADTDEPLQQNSESSNDENRSEIQRLQEENNRLTQELKQVLHFQQDKDCLTQQLESDREQLQMEINRLQQEVDEAHEAGSSAALWKQHCDEVIKQADQFRLQQTMKDRVFQKELNDLDNEKKDVERQLEKAHAQLDDLKNAASGERTEDIYTRIQQLETENKDLQLQLRFQQLDVGEGKDESGFEQDASKLREEISSLKDRLEQQDLELKEVLSQDEQRAHEYQKEKETYKQCIAELERRLADANCDLKKVLDEADEVRTEALAKQEYELNMQFQEQRLELQNEWEETKEMLRKAVKDKRVMQEMYEQQSKPRPVPVPRARPEIVKQLQEKTEALNEEISILKEKNSVLQREKHEIMQQMDHLTQQMGGLRRRVNNELDERNEQAGIIKLLEQVIESKRQRIAWFVVRRIGIVLCRNDQARPERTSN